MLPKGELNKMIRVHRVAWGADKTHKEDIKTIIKTPNKWDSTANRSSTKWVDTSNRVFTDKCIAVRSQECPHHHHI